MTLDKSNTALPAILRAAICVYAGSRHTGEEIEHAAE